MDPKMRKLVEEWKATLTPEERTLHEMAAVMLKKSIQVDMEKDNGSYYEEKCHGFKAWLKSQTSTKPNGE